MSREITIFKDIPALLKGLGLPLPRNRHFQIHRFEDAPDSQLNETAIFRSNTYVIALITEGEAHYKIGLRDYEMTKGSLYFLGPKHLRYYNRKEKWKGFVCIFTDEFTTKNRVSNNYSDYTFYHLDASQKLQLDEKNLHYLKGLLETLLNCFENNKMDLCWHHLQIVLLEAEALHRYEHKSQETKPEAITVIKFNELLEKHFYDIVTNKAERIFSVNDFADKLFIHPNYLSNTLKKITGETAGQIIKKRTILEAKSLLLTTGMSVSQAAYSLKFNDTSYFTKFFKSAVGLTPKQYQAQK